MSLISTLISRVAALTTAVNSIAQKAKLISELPFASTPLNDADLLMISQSGVNKKVEASNFSSGGTSSSGKIQYGDYQIYGASGNSLETVQAGDLIQGWWSTTEFWTLAKYNGGDVTLRTNYTIINSTEGL